jgi:hypothetical protein
MGEAHMIKGEKQLAIENYDPDGHVATHNITFVLSGAVRDHLCYMYAQIKLARQTLSILSNPKNRGGVPLVAPLSQSANDIQKQSPAISGAQTIWLSSRNSSFIFLASFTVRRLQYQDDNILF